MAEITLNPDGPHSPERTRQVADALAEAVRFLNHATLNHAGEALAYPADADAVIEALATAAMRLPQLCEQIGEWLERQDAGGRLAVGDGPFAGDSAAAVREAVTSLTLAALVADAVYHALDQARQVTATISAASSSSEGEGSG